MRKYLKQIRGIIPLVLLLTGMGWFGLGLGGRGLTLAEAADYYMGNPGDNFQSLAEAFNSMSGGDTLVIRDGTYTGSSNIIDYAQHPPNGTAGSYTVIRAENLGGVTIQASFNVDSSQRMRYWQFEGIKWVGGIGLVNADHIKFLRCVAEGNVPAGNTTTFSVLYSSDILLEDCIAYGKGRYKFLIYESTRVVLRRCIARQDYASSGGDPIAVFSIYSTSNAEVQNCISIDGDQGQYWIGSSEWGGAFYAPGNSSNVNWRGCIAINMAMGGGSATLSPQFENMVIWHTVNGLPWFNSGATIQHATIGNLISGSGPINGGMGNGAQVIGNSIVMDAYSTAIVENSLGYNALWNNSNNGSTRSTDITNVNPLNNSLKYLPRIEANSDLSGRASDSGDIGATILKRIGRNGTLYGETGYNEITNENLWPLPNEDWAKQVMSNYDQGSSGLPNPVRGFTAYQSPFGSRNTLTSYIWEYLGNPIPPEIYGTPADLAITTTSLSDGTVGSTYSQTIRATGGTTPYTWSITSGSLPVGLSLDPSNGIISGTPTTGSTYNFTVHVQDSAADTDTQDLAITINAQANTPPTASASANPTSGTAPLTVNFTGSGSDTDGTIASYSWDFDDGNTSNEQNPSHTYNNAGTYTAILTVTDDDGGTDSDSVTIVVTSVSGGTVYYVATNGSDSNPGTQSRPWRTIQYSAGQVQPGDTVLIQPGTYTINSQLNISSGGAVGNPITFRGNGDSIILDMTNCSNRNCLEIGWADYVTIENIEVIASQTASGDVRGIRVIYSSNVILRSNIIRGAGHANIFASFSDDILIENNEIYGATAQGSPTGGVGIYIADGTDRAIIRGNTIHDNVSIGIHMNADISGSISGMLVENNIIYNNGSTGINLDGVTNSTFRNNLIYNNQRRGIVFFQGDSAQPSNNNEVYHNTIVMPSTGYYIIGVNTGSTQNKIYNNILLSSNNVPAIDSNTGSYTGLESNYNLMSSSQLTSQRSRGFDQNSQQGTLTNTFINSSANDYHLTATSPAKDTGTTNLTYNQDIESNSRPQGTTPDIGAYEYLSPIQPIRGDVNGDGLVNVVDVQLAVNQFLGVIPQTQEADLNGDGVVNVIDVQLLVNIILGG